MYRALINGVRIDSNLNQTYYGCPPEVFGGEYVKTGLKEQNMDSVWAAILAGGLTISFLWIAWSVKSLIDRLITLIMNVNEKLSVIEGEIRPILRDVEQTLKNVEPLTKELGERKDEIGRLLENIEKVSDDAQATTGAVRTGIVPVANSVQALFAGLMQGAQVLGEYRNQRDDETENY